MPIFPGPLAVLESPGQSRFEVRLDSSAGSADNRRVKKPAIILLGLVFLLLIAASALAGDRIRCSHCGQEITQGKYVQVDGKFYHENHFLCASCRKPIGSSALVKADGRYYHAKCYETQAAPRCAFCYNPIKGKYIEFKGKSYHPICYENNIALRCDFCGGIIEGEYFTDFWGDRYHAYHEGEVPECDYCGRLLGDRSNRGGVKYPDGRHVCDLCRRTTVDNLTSARRLLEETRERLRTFGIAVDHDEISLTLTSKDEIARHLNSARTSQTGFVKHHYSTRHGVVTDQTFDIYILKGMPRMYYISTAAHELMHVWQNLNGPLENDDPLCEGSCNYASRLVLEQVGGAGAEYLLRNLQQNTDPIYGEGYRRVARLVRNRGLDYLLNHLKLNSDFPEGY